jgi:uncharacterized protein YegP (UPF0339 family)
MKKVVLGILSVFMSVCFISCESDTESIDEVNKLKEFSFARDEFGNFTLKYEVVEGFSSEEYDNFDTGRKEITFNSSSANSSSMSSDLEMVDSQVKIGFLEVDGSSDEFISVEDDDITSFQMKQNNPLLKWYEVYRNKKGKYVINFKTKKNVIVDYKFNKKKGENEIWLIRAGEGRVVGNNEHKRNYSYTEGDTLTITFISEIKKGNSKNESVENLQGFIRKPRIIIKDDRPSDY